jgi:hypothetical protein
MARPDPLVVRPAKEGQKVPEASAKGTVGQELHGVVTSFDLLGLCAPDVSGKEAPQRLTEPVVAAKKSGEREEDADGPQQELEKEVGIAAEKMEGSIW